MLEPDPAEVADRVVAHFRAARRDLPWRRTRDPYAVWVSEVMLQQTRVATVVPYYERWLARFPTAAALAAAPLDEVLASWAGLGYYGRARNLHRGAREVVARYGGRLPDQAAELRSVPGIGRYTAGAIASIAFGRREPLVDGNVARVLARVYEIETDIKAAAAQRRLWELAAALVPGEAPGDFNQGLMELGATVCTPQGPSCLLCPLAGLCAARAHGRQDELPVASGRRAADDLPLIAAAAAWIERRGRLLLVRRRPAGLYGGLWELPQADRADRLAAAIGAPLELLAERPVAEHAQLLSHRRLRIALWPARIRDGRAAKLRPDPDRYDQAAWQPLARLSERGLSSATRTLIQKHRENSWPTPKPRSVSSPKATQRSSRGSSRSATTSTTTRTSPARRSGPRAG